MTKMPETIWAEDEHGDDHEDQGSYGSWDCRNAYGYVHEYIRADISKAAIAAAIEMAAKRNELTVRSIKEALDYREWEAAREIAMKGPPAIRALATPAQTDALEAVRLEAERAGYERGVREAANVDYNLEDLNFDGVWTLYEHGVHDMQEAIMALIKPIAQEDDA